MVIIKIKGGLGNQLFQYATALYLAHSLNTSLLIDNTFFNDERYKGIFRLDKYNIDLKYASEKEIKRLKNKPNPNIIYKGLNKFGVHTKHYRLTHWGEKDLEFFYKEDKHVDYDIYLEGWLAKHEYFQTIRDILTRELIPKQISNKSLDWTALISKSNSVSLHIRRGDYLSNPYFHNLSINHYLNAINIITKNVYNPVFFVFSDDINYVKNKFSHISNIHFVDTNNEIQNKYSTYQDIEDLYLMSKCKHNIIANSTFSWWGAWLNTNEEKIVIAPKKWYDNKQAQEKYEEGNTLPDNWIKL